MSDIGERIKTLRMERKILQKDIVKECDIALRSLIYYEKSERKPDSETIIKLCRYFNVSADYLLGLSDDPERR